MKRDLIIALFKSDPNRLQELSRQAAIRKLKSRYFFRVDGRHRQALAGTNMSQIGGRVRSDSARDVLVECRKAVLDSSTGTFSLQLKVHSPKRRIRGEDAVTLRPIDLEIRKGFSVYLVAHPNDGIIECLTSSGDKAALARICAGKILFNDSDALVPIILKHEDLKRIDQEIRHRRAIVENLSFPGTSEITLSGEDVAQTIEFLKENGINLTAYGGDIRLERMSLPAKTIKSYPDGKVTCRGATVDPYTAIRNAL